jgi:hypothetical protein
VVQAQADVVPREANTFEVAARPTPSRRAPEAAIAKLPILVGNLGLPDSPASASLAPLLLDFIVHHHLNIEWYEKRMRKELLQRRLFFWFSIILLAAIPVVTYLVSAQATEDNSKVIMVQITAVLTGIIGFHSALRSFFDKRNLITIFHKASAALKKAVYDFEDRWAGCVPLAEGEQLELFKGNLRNAIRRARDVEAEEREAYFASQSALPLIDLRATLAEAGSAAAEIVGRHGVQRNARGAIVVAGADPAAALRARVDTLRAKLTALVTNAAAAQLEGDTEQAQLIDTARAKLTAELREVEAELLAMSMRQFDRIP